MLVVGKWMTTEERSTERILNLESVKRHELFLAEKERLRMHELKQRYEKLVISRLIGGN
jgi:hypothetical protein